jgi:hypothetical protein
MPKSDHAGDIGLALFVGYTAGAYKLSGKETVNLLLDPITDAAFDHMYMPGAYDKMIDSLRIKLGWHDINSMNRSPVHMNSANEAYRISLPANNEEAISNSANEVYSILLPANNEAAISNSASSGSESSGSASSGRSTRVGHALANMLSRINTRKFKRYLGVAENRQGDNSYGKTRHHKKRKSRHTKRKSKS